MSASASQLQVPRPSAFLALLVAAALGSGCALSRSSSESSSAVIQSSSSVFLSLSSSASSAAAADASYARDLTAVTVAFAESGAIPREPFLREVGRVADDHGISDWQDRDTTYRAIGTGLRLGSANETRVRSFAARVFRDEPVAGEAILAGYRAEGGP